MSVATEIPRAEVPEVKEEEAERLHFQKVINAFRIYKKHSLNVIQRKENYLNQLPQEHQKLLKKNGYGSMLNDLKSAVDVNNEIVQHILKDIDNVFDNLTHQSKGEKDKRTMPNGADMEKVQSCLKQLVRDWSEAGIEERSACNKKITDKLAVLFKEEERESKKVLVPGAGLGRLAFDIAQMGFECQGNEFSLFMLFTSNFVLNKCTTINSFKIQPYIHNFCNNISDEDQLKTVHFPDVDPNQLPEDRKFSMAAGDFLEVYNEAEYVSSQDCVATCFFMDCAHNIVDFIQTIHKVLKPGGYWINLGPLLYHFSDMPGETSIEPSYDCVRGIIKDFGFEIMEEEKDIMTTYDQNPASMLQYSYKSVYFCAKKM
ncbi:carnosine N-methyltransferase [Eurytemora carolleeae]|uniref:carnosine N-methyltransferase n=1 Tax=Eurytemora carolleeae TaxID=1294199 RepID=UPI000C77B9CF|nr:carnosine N-methyltransferase [Eurytemora carolleeae]|eukprot:XP_023344235.1 carnosine N-methyltransferase-like [Eurytemora affinis]